MRVDGSKFKVHPDAGRVRSPEHTGKDSQSENEFKKPGDDLDNTIQDPEITDGETKTKEDEIPEMPNSGTLLVDATIAEQQIEYPTDLKMLNESLEQQERIIEQVCREGSLVCCGF